MRKWIFLFIIILFITGCSSEMEMTLSSSDIALSSVISQENEVINFPEGNTVGIFADGNNGTFFSNLSYTMKNSILNPNGDQSLQFQNETTQLQLYAYSPFVPNDRFNNKIMTVEISLDQERDGVTSSDVLWGNTVISASSPQASISFLHKMTRLLINLESVTNESIADAKVTALAFPKFANLNINTGAVTPSKYSDKVSIIARKISTGCYEVIVPPIVLTEKIPLFKIENQDKSYYHYSQGYKKLISGGQYTYNLKIWDGDELPFSIELYYQNKKLEPTINVPSKATQGELTMTASTGYNNEKMGLRTSDENVSWVYMKNDANYGREEILSTLDKQILHFKENLDKISRSTELEFYDLDKPQNVYKRITVVQEASTDYFELDLSELNVDRYGNEYDVPHKLKVSSNLNWTIEAPDWIEATYTNGGMSQDVAIIVRENKTGLLRTGTVKFMVNGTIHKEFAITQTAIENTSFTLKYEMNLKLTTINGKFKGETATDQKIYYPTLIEIFNHYPGSFGDETAMIYSYAPYGFISDYPVCNTLIVENFVSDDYFIYRNYKGQQTNLPTGPISIGDRLYSQSFFRNLYITLPIPANVKRTQKVIYHVIMNNITANGDDDDTTVTYEIVEQ